MKSRIKNIIRTFPEVFHIKTIQEIKVIKTAVPEKGAHLLKPNPEGTFPSIGLAQFRKIGIGFEIGCVCKQFKHRRQDKTANAFLIIREIGHSFTNARSYCML